MRGERNISFLLAGIAGICALAALIHTFPPRTLFLIFIFFLLLFTSVYSMIFFIISHKRRSLLMSLAIAGILFLKMIGLGQLLYIGLFLASLISLELSVQRR